MRASKPAVAPLDLAGARREVPAHRDALRGERGERDLDVASRNADASRKPRDRDRTQRLRGASARCRASASLARRASSRIPRARRCAASWWRTDARRAHAAAARPRRASAAQATTVSHVARLSFTSLSASTGHPVPRATSSSSEEAVAEQRVVQLVARCRPPATLPRARARWRQRRAGRGRTRSRDRASAAP